MQSLLEGSRFVSVFTSVFLLDLFLKLMIFVWGVLFTCVTCPFCTEVQEWVWMGICCSKGFHIFLCAVVSLGLFTF